MVLNPVTLEWMNYLGTTLTLIWNAFVLIYCYKTGVIETKQVQERPLMKWWLKQGKLLVILFSVGILLVSIGDATRIHLASQAVADETVELSTLWYVVVALENVVFYLTAALPATFFFVYCWGVNVVDQIKQGRLDKEARAYIKIQREGWMRISRRERERG